MSDRGGRSGSPTPIITPLAQVEAIVLNDEGKIAVAGFYNG